MTLTRRIARLGSLGSLVSGLLAHHPAAAGQVAIFDRTVPQAAEPSASRTWLLAAAVTRNTPGPDGRGRSRDRTRVAGPRSRARVSE